MCHFNLLKTFAIAIVLLVTFTLTACFGGSASEPTRYYTLAIENINTPSTYKANGKVQIRKFSVDEAYQKSNIVYRESAYDFMVYDLDLWASRPEHMITQVASEYITRSHLFQSVEIKSSSKPDFEIVGQLDAIEEVDEGNLQFARLALKLSFRKTENDSILWENRYDEKLAMSKREPHYMAESTSKLLAKFMEDAIAHIAASMPIQQAAAPQVAPQPKEVQAQ